MIVVVGRVRTDAQRRARLIEIGQRVAQASRAEPGCISYRLHEDTEVENDFVFVEEWQDDDALQATSARRTSRSSWARSRTLSWPRRR